MKKENKTLLKFIFLSFIIMLTFSIASAIEINILGYTLSTEQTEQTEANEIHQVHEIKHTYFEPKILENGIVEYSDKTTMAVESIDIK